MRKKKAAESESESESETKQTKENLHMNKLIAAKEAETAAKDRVAKAEAEAAKQKEAAAKAAAEAKAIQKRFDSYKKIKEQKITDLIKQLASEGKNPTVRVIYGKDGTTPIGIEGGEFHQRQILDANGNPTGAMAVGRNEAELKADENRYWTFLAANGGNHNAAIRELAIAETYVGAGYTGKGLATITVDGEQWIVDAKDQCARKASDPTAKVSNPLKTKLALEDLCTLISEKLGKKAAKPVANSKPDPKEEENDEEEEDDDDDSYTSDDLADAASEGYADGKSDGYTEGYAAGLSAAIRLYGSPSMRLYVVTYTRMDGRKLDVEVKATSVTEATELVKSLIGTALAADVHGWSTVVSCVVKA